MGGQGANLRSFASAAFCCGSFALLLTSFIYAIITRKEVYLLRDGFTNMVSNWNSDMVFGLSLQSSPVLPSPQENYYVTEWNSPWPGNIDGCYCYVSNSRRKVTQGLKTRSCNTNETSVGCRDISETGPQTINKWKNSQTVYAIRGKGTSFYANYQKINSDGSCAAGFKHCGDKNSKSKGLCIPEKFTSCPVSDIQSTQPGDYSSLALSGMTLYYSNTNKYNSVCDLVYSQEFTCFIRSHFSTTPGRKPYELLKGDRTSCIRDPTVWSIAEIGETDILDLNSINHKKLISFDTNNNWKWRMTVGRFIDWSPFCQATVASIVDKTKDLEAMADSYFTLFVIYIISFCLGVIAMIGRTWMWFLRIGVAYKLAFFGRIITFVLVAPSLIICTAKASQFLSFFKSISELGCSNTETNAIFVQIAENVRVKIVSKTILFLVLGYVGFLCDIIAAIIDLNCGLLDGPLTFNNQVTAQESEPPKQEPPKLQLPEPETISILAKPAPQVELGQGTYESTAKPTPNIHQDPVVVQNPTTNPVVPLMGGEVQPLPMQPALPLFPQETRPASPASVRRNSIIRANSLAKKPDEESSLKRVDPDDSDRGSMM